MLDEEWNEIDNVSTQASTIMIQVIDSAMLYQTTLSAVYLSLAIRF